jgi:pimeloyl-ACP methyl ester carboxylesterase
MSTNESAPVLFLLPDRTHGFSAREAVESAPLTLGAASNDFTLISISPRGSTDSPVLLTDVNILSSLDVMDDVAAVQTALNIDEMAVIGWGSGATTAAALVMSYPGRVSAAVLDAPQDPAVSMVRQAEKQLESMKAAVETAMRWCASHLSCPSNANVAKELSRFKTNLRLGRLGEGVDFGTVARAATRSISDGDPQSFFIALNEASNGNGAALLSLAGPVPTAESSRASCADVTLSASKRIASLFAAHIASKPRHFYMGTEAQTYGFCPGLPATQRPIGAVEPDPEAMNAPVFVTIARGNPVVPPYTPRTMAKRMGWTYKSVFANRHLVIGYDQAITRAAFEFLASSLDD